MTRVIELIQRLNADAVAAGIRFTPATGIVLTVSLLLAAVGLWSLWRVRRLLAVVPAVEERIAALSNSTTLLTDTTESCFRALSMQLQFMQSQHVHQVRRPVIEPPAKSSRTTRQRRIVNASKRGDTVASIAAREDLSETEVALQLHVNGKTQVMAGNDPYDTLRS